MYETDFGLSERPFVAAPRTDRYFAAPNAEEAHQTLARCIERAEGVGLLLGPSGTGKTLLCHLLAEQFGGSIQVALPTTGRVSSPKSLLQSILFELNRPYRDMDEGELRLALIDHLSCDERCPNGVLLIIDEAQGLSLRLMEELRLIGNLMRQGQPRVRLLIAGSLVLEERFANPKLELFSQRVAARAYLETLNQDETRGYVVAQIAACGGDAERIFDGDAMIAIHRASDGIPRLINQLCDHVLILAHAGGRSQISAAGVEEAWADLQRMPTAWNEPDPHGRSESEGNVVEFGGLDDEPQIIEVAASESITLDAYSADDAESPEAESIQVTSRDGEGIGEDLQPAAALEPEVELTLDLDRAPRQESSEEDEEIVIDHYADFDAAEWSAPVVINRLDGDALAELLKPFSRHGADDRLRLVDASTADESLRPETQQHGESAGTVESNDESKDGESQIQSNAASHQARMRDTGPTPQYVSDPPTGEPSALSINPDPPTARLRMVDMAAFDQLAIPSIGFPADELPGIDDELIVVEDDPQEWEPSINVESMTTRPQAFGRLFSRLKSG